MAGKMRREWQVSNPGFYVSGSEDSVGSPASIRKHAWPPHTWTLSFHPMTNSTMGGCCCSLPSSPRCALLAALAGLLVILPLLVVSVWWSSAQPPATSTGDHLHKKIQMVDLTFRIVNQRFHGDLVRAGSERHSRLAREITHAVDRIFQLSPMRRKYNSSRVLAFRGGSVVTECRLQLNCPLAEATNQLAAVFMRALHESGGLLPATNLMVELASVKFFEVPGQVLPSAMEVSSSGVQADLGGPEWSEWSSWSPCRTSSGECLSAQTRTRFCKDGPEGGRLLGNQDCLEQSGSPAGDWEVKECQCHGCRRCRPGEICLQTVGASLPSCQIPRDPSDPTGCGGWCGPVHELCKRLPNNTFQCLDDSECLPDEWRCGNGMCLPLEKRCDGHFNCFDHSDELECECARPGDFHCGSNTSCIQAHRRCDGTPDCWDGSDEADCPSHCREGEFECPAGEDCLPASAVCDGKRDCSDGSDELHCLPQVFSPSDARPA